MNRTFSSSVCSRSGAALFHCYSQGVSPL